MRIWTSFPELYDLLSNQWMYWIRFPIKPAKNSGKRNPVLGIRLIKKELFSKLQYVSDFVDGYGAGSKD